MVSWEFRCCKNMLLFFKCAVSSRQKSKKRLVNEHRWVSPAPNGWQSWELFSQTCQYTANSPQTRDWVPNPEHIPSTRLCLYNGFMLDLQIDCWARKNWLEIVVVVLFFLWNSDIVYTENTIQSFRFWFKDFHGKWKKRENEKRCISIGDTRFMLVFYAPNSIGNSYRGNFLIRTFQLKNGTFYAKASIIQVTWKFVGCIFEQVASRTSRIETTITRLKPEHPACNGKKCIASALRNNLLHLNDSSQVYQI